MTTTATPTTARAGRSALRTGVLAGIGAYGLWGLFPLFWPLLEPAAPMEILAHRIAWSLIFCALLLTVTRGWPKVGAVLHDRRRLLLLAGASAVVAVNWGTYIWAVNAHHVVETSLGYFINPLVSVAIGVAVLRERLRPLQWAAVGIAALAVVVLTVDYGRLPWIALVLAVSFGTYGFLKKLANVESIPSLAVETGLSFPLAFGYLVWLEATGGAAFGHVSAGNTLLLAACGVVTAVPLILFNSAAIRIPLSMLGVLQYIAPVLQFLIGVLVIGEPMPASRWIGFTIVWIALTVFTVDALTHARRMRLAVPEPV